MSNFRKGQKLVCVNSAGWIPAWPHARGGAAHPGPSNGDIVTFDGDHATGACIYLKEFQQSSCGISRDAYEASCFRPLIEDLTAELARKAEDSLVHERPERVNEPQVA